jgi:hypothetical protein
MLACVPASIPRSPSASQVVVRRLHADHNVPMLLRQTRNLGRIEITRSTMSVIMPNPAMLIIANTRVFARSITV